MNRFMLFPLLLLTTLLISCSTTKEVKKLPQMKLAETVLAKGINKGTIGTPVNPSSTFTTEDPEAVAYLKFENMHGTHKVRWDWIDPSGKLYYSSGDYSLSVPEGQYQESATVWHKLPILDQKAGRLAGNWQVNVSFDGEPLTSKSFNIETAEIDVDKLPNMAAKPNPLNWGLVVGIESYPNLPAVDFARKDAQIVKDYFVKLLGVPEENLIFLADGKATKSTMEGYLKNYLPKNMDMNSTLYIYFAGHGSPDMEKGDAYLIPYDGDPRFIAQTGYKLKDFYEDIDKMNIKRSFVFLDSCFSGSSARGDKMLMAGIRPALIHVEDVALKFDKIVSLSATKEGQVSNSYPEKKHGLFTYYLLSGFRGQAGTDSEGWVTVGALYKYVKENVSRASRRKGVEQTPSVNPLPDVVKNVEDIRVGQVVR